MFTYGSGQHKEGEIMANTTNLSLGKLAGTENLKNFPTVQSDNMDKIDQAVGAGFGSTRNVGGVTDALADAIAILANGNTHAAITSGQYVYVKNHASLTEGLYVATTNIAANATLSGSNLSADSSGGLNAALASAKSYTDGLIGTVPSGNTVEGQITSLSNQIGNFKLIKTSVSGNGSKNITVANSSRLVLHIFGEAASYNTIAHVRATGNGTVRAYPLNMANDSNISFDVSVTRNLAITNSGSSSVDVFIETIEGDATV